MSINDHSTTTSIQITFHYMNGQSESFSVSSPVDEAGTLTQQDIQQEIRQFLKEDWWMLKLMDETVVIQASNVLKVEIKPPMASIQGHGVLSNAQRVTALNRIR
ncbi:MAG: hypothetical protein VKJ46_16540 [Leptolyngbyaceae bacterium]|nr:hypothetical protein [Leptolyngbyaceae bacterium]